MTSTAASPQATLPWLTDKLRSVALGVRSQGGLIGLKGVGLAVSSNISALRNGLHADGIEVLFLDPRSPEPEMRSLQGVLGQYLIRVQARGNVSDEAMLLAQSLRGQDGRGASGRLRRDTLGRLWTVLSQATSGVLIVANPGEATATERKDIEHLARFVFADPIDQLQPESGHDEMARGVMVFLEDWSGLELKDAQVEVLDGSANAADEVRELLKEDDVVRLLVQTSGGDVERVRELLTQLPAQAENLQMFRFRQLEPREQLLLELLAVADEAISVDRLQRAAKEAGAADFYARSLRNLCDGGFASRVVSRGEILVRLIDTDFGRQLRIGGRLQALHLALANAEATSVTGDRSLAFMSRHFLAAGHLDRATECGTQASLQLLSRNDIDGAIELLESLQAAGVILPFETRRNLADLYVRSGEILPAVELLTTLLDEPISEFKASIELKIAELQVKLGHFDAALARAENAGSETTEIRHGVELVRAEVDYALGRHDELLTRLTTLLDELKATDAGAARRAEIDRTTLRTRNTLGKALIFRADYAQAEDMFRHNRTLAHQWGWDDEVARAQANLGVVALQRNNYAEALARLQEALDSTGMRGSLPRAYCLVNLATVYQQRNEFEAALDVCLESLRSAKQAGDAVAYSVAAHNLATIYQDIGAFSRAHAVLEHLNERYEPEQETLSSRWNQLVIGYLSLDEGLYERAIGVFESLSITDESLIYGPEAGLRLVQAHLALGQDQAARAAYNGFSIDTESGDYDKLNSIAELVGAQIDLLDENFEAALTRSREHGTRLATMGAKTDPITARMVAAEALVGLNRSGEARNELEEGARVIEEMGRLVPADFKRTFFRKPAHQRLLARLRKLDGSIPKEMLEAPVIEPRASTVNRSRYAQIVGNDPKLHQIFHIIDRVAPSRASVLIYGESGTGKELISEAIHNESKRAQKPFVKVNCAAFVENLLLSELFGHERGAFTGAASQKKGRFEVANGGTIFLDEIGDISPNTQVALLRVLQEGTFERVGGSDTIHADVRVICATNRNLEEMVESGEFRLDLYYRLKGVVVEAPALRERRQDIPVLVRHFTRQFSEGALKTFSSDAMQFLSSYSWPGNVRELQNFVRSMLLFVEGQIVTASTIDDFADFFVSGSFAETAIQDLDADCTCGDCDTVSPVQLVATSRSLPTQKLRPIISGEISAEQAQDSLVTHIVRDGLSLSELKRQLETQAIRRALIESSGNVTKAAEMLRMKRPRLSQIVNASDELSKLKMTLTG